MSLLDKFSYLPEMGKHFLANKVNPLGVSFSRILSATSGEIDGQPVVLAGTNNYLGLTFNPEVIAATKAAVDAFGAGTTGSRMANGTYLDHLALEKDLAEFYGVCCAIVFTTGYQANLGIISTLAQEGDCIVMDSDSHASIYDAVSMSNAKTYRFKHNDPESLAKKLRLLGDKAKRTLIIVESLYSMLGDRGCLREFIAVKKEYGGFLLVDEAHAMGVLGSTGRGLVEELDVADDVDFITGTFSKSVGSVGGYCVSNHPLMDLVRNVIRVYTFTASSTPASIATARASLAIIRKDQSYRKKLWDNIHKLHSALSLMGFKLGAAPGPVVSVIIAGSNFEKKALEAWNLMIAQGVYVNLALPPASPGRYALLRCSLSAAHDEEQIDKIILSYRTLAEEKVVD